MFKFFKKLFRKSPRRKGRLITLSALAFFKSDNDLRKFNDIRDKLQDVVLLGQSLSGLAIKTGIQKISEELKVNPILFAMLASELMNYADPDEPDNEKDLMEFLKGILDAINIVVPRIQTL